MMTQMDFNCNRTFSCQVRYFKIMVMLQFAAHTCSHMWLTWMQLKGCIKQMLSMWHVKIWIWVWYLELCHPAAPLLTLSPNLLQIPVWWYSTSLGALSEKQWSSRKCPQCWLPVKTVGQNPRFCSTGSVFWRKKSSIKAASSWWWLAWGLWLPQALSDCSKPREDKKFLPTSHPLAAPSVPRPVGWEALLYLSQELHKRIGGSLTILGLQKRGVPLHCLSQPLCLSSPPSTCSEVPPAF